MAEKIPYEQYVNAAKRLYHEEGTLEIDNTAIVSNSKDEGVYVQAWVWVSDADATEVPNG